MRSQYTSEEQDLDRLVVSVHYYRLVAKEVGAKGKKLEQLLRGTGISPHSFIHDEFLVNYRQQAIITLNAMNMLGSSDLALRVGCRFTPEAQGPIGFLVSSSPNVQTALQNFQTFLPLIFPYLDMELISTRDQLICRLQMNHKTGDQRLDTAGLECAMLALCAIISAVTGDKLQSAEAHFTYDEPPYAEKYHEVFPFPVLFSAKENCLILDRALGWVSNPIASKANYSFALDQCQAMMKKLPHRGKSMSDRVKQLLLSSPPGTINEAAVAEALFCSRRTLSRRLAEEGTSFRKVKTDILADIAIRHLTHTSDTVESIAALLNYYDTANFRKAFKKWCLLTPEEYRRRHGNL